MSGAAALPATGWVLMAPVVVGKEAPVRIDMALLHPLLGVALVEFEPAWTPDAAMQLRQALAQARFAASYGGIPPIVHLLARRDDLSSLPAEVMGAFRADWPLAMSSGAWVEPVRAMLRQPPPAAAAAPVEGLEYATEPRRLVAGALAAAGLTGLALAGAGGLLAPPEPAQPSLAAAEPLPASPQPAAALLPPLVARGVDPCGVSPAPEAPPMIELRAVPFDPVPPAPPMVDILTVPEGALPRAAAAPVPHVEVEQLPLPPPQPPAPAPRTGGGTAGRRPDTALIDALIRRANQMGSLGDMAAARKFFERAAQEGSVDAALALGRSLEPDPVAAEAWYRRAEEMMSKK